MADNTANETQKQNKPTAAPKPKAKETATFNQDKPDIVKLVTPKGTQLYNPVTRVTYTSGKPQKGSMSDQFVVTNLNRGKLKKA
jgi:hypothetical protein